MVYFSFHKKDNVLNNTNLKKNIYGSQEKDFAY